MFLVFATEFIQGFGAVLQSPEVFEPGIGAADDVGSHNVWSDGEIESAKTSGHGHTHKSGLTACLKVADCSGGVGHASVAYGGTVVVYIGGVVGDDVAAEVAYDLQYAVVVVDGVIVVYGSVVILLCLRVVALFEGDNLAHHGMRQVVAQVGIVCIEVCHGA